MGLLDLLLGNETNYKYEDAVSLFKKDVIFHASRYEEWCAGRCISKGNIDVIITGKVDRESIIFSLDKEVGLRIKLPCRFDFRVSEILSDGRIQYMNINIDYNPVNPVLCHIFFKDGGIDYVRFGMTNPDRLIEFY